YQFGYTSPPTKTLTATLPAGTWAVTISADDYCGGSSNAATHFDVVPSTVSSTNTTTVSATTTTTVSSSNTTSVATTFAVTSTSTSSSMTSTFTSATRSVTVTSITTITGAATLVNFLTTTITDQWTVSMLTTIVQGSTTSTVVSIQNLPLELALGSILTISLLIIAISLIRGPWFGSAITCSKCGFKNSSTASSFCIKCGQPLKRGQST